VPFCPCYYHIIENTACDTVMLAALMVVGLYRGSRALAEGSGGSIIMLAHAYCVGVMAVTT